MSNPLVINIGFKEDVSTDEKITKITSFAERHGFNYKKVYSDGQSKAKSKKIS